MLVIMFLKIALRITIVKLENAFVKADTPGALLKTDVFKFLFAARLTMTVETASPSSQDSIGALKQMLAIRFLSYALKWALIIARLDNAFVKITKHGVRLKTLASMFPIAVSPAIIADTVSLSLLAQLGA